MKNSYKSILLLVLVFTIQQLILSQVKSVEAVGFTVSDMNRSVDFYTDVLQFKKISDIEVTGNEYDRLTGIFGTRLRIVKMQIGDEQIELTQFLVPKGKPVPIDSHSNDLWFQHIAIVVSDMEKAFNQLKKFSVEYVSTAPQTIPESNTAAAGIKAFYFRDPDGHNLELIYFPPGKGNPKWQKKQGLFLGIDHTAIGISYTEESLKFYRDQLGLTVAGESFNYGTEQEHLNNVFGASLHITGLRAPDGGPGVEFLEYLAPRTSRKYPEDASPNDLIHWQTTFSVSDIDKLSQTLRNELYNFISPDVIYIPDERLGYKKAALVRDLDGHAILLIQKED